MKKILSLILCAILAAGLFAGCNLVEHDYEADYAQVIVTINPITQTVNGKRQTFNSRGMPICDDDGNYVTENVESTYTSPKIEIRKSQLVNYVEYYLPTQLQEGNDLQSSLDYFVNMIVNTELLLIEADKLFDAGILYWTQDEIADIQRSVYSSINDGIFGAQNQKLEDMGKDPLAAPSEEPAPGETTYPVMPEDEAEESVSPAYYFGEEYYKEGIAVHAGEFHWFDNWYTEDAWYIEDSAYKNSYPGFSPNGTLSDKSLAAEAFANYLDDMLDKADSIIDVTKEEREAVKQDLEDIAKIRKLQGVEYVYPMLGQTTLIKLLVGNTYIKSAKLEKLESYIVENVEISELDINKYYEDLLAQQKLDFVDRASYDSAVSGGSTILYTPNSRYVYVKHILIPFTDVQSAQLKSIAAREGIADTTKISVDPEKRTVAENRYIQERAKLARKIPVYTHVNGEDMVDKDGNKIATTVEKVTETITEVMRQFEGSAQQAERAFNRFIYQYNTDPGIFGNEKGYAVVYDLDDDESETYMIEFAEAARAFRKQSRYRVGQIYYDTEHVDENGKDVPYIITDYGIHIMYYCMDTAEGTKGLSDYVTPGKYTKIHDLMESEALAAAQAEVYDQWADRYLKDTKARETTTKTKIINKYYDELYDIIYG